jgi:transaldolase
MATTPGEPVSGPGTAVPATDYFSRLVAETPTRVWVNNPTERELGLALAHGAVGCTTNPAFGGSLLHRAPAEMLPILDECLAASGDDHHVAGLIQERLVGRIASRFLPLFESTGGRAGFVSIQGSPDLDVDGESIWRQARVGRTIGPNVAPKIPATLPGFAAMVRVIEHGWPIVVTEVFSLDQVAVACELYLATTARTGVTSPFFMAPITGIFGDHLRKVARARGLDVPAPAIELAGIGLGRRCAALVAQRGYPVTLLFGGARIPEDLTGLVGDPHHATINWSTFAEILQLDPAVTRTIDSPMDPDVERVLLASFPDVAAAWELGRLTPEEFEHFGPVQHFRDAFLDGWHAVLGVIADRRLATE